MWPHVPPPLLSFSFRFQFFDVSWATVLKNQHSNHKDRFIAIIMFRARPSSKTCRVHRFAKHNYKCSVWILWHIPAGQFWRSISCSINKSREWCSGTARRDLLKSNSSQRRWEKLTWPHSRKGLFLSLSLSRTLSSSFVCIFLKMRFSQQRFALMKKEQAVEASLTLIWSTTLSFFVTCTEQLAVIADFRLSIPRRLRRCTDG